MCFGRAFHLILIHFYFLYSMRWESFQKSGYFYKKLFFHNFDWSNLIFDQSKSCLKNLVSLCLVQLIEPCFSINRTSCFKFFKNSVLIDSNTFSKLFSNFSLSLQLGKAPLKIFCCFQPNFCKVFLSQGR